MAQMTYSELQSSQETTTNTNSFSDRPRVGYFSLANNGDTAVVRIMHDSPDTFEIVSVHSTYVDGKFRKINCLRNYGDPVDNCPLCVKDAMNNAYPSKRIYIHMIQYIKDETGAVVAQPVVWDRPAKKYCDKLINLMQEYGNLSDMIVKIKRNGAAGDTNTDYDILPANQQVYPSNIYVKDESLFEGYSVLNGAVLNKNFEDLSYFAQYDSFPQENSEESSNGWGGVESEGVPFDTAPVSTATMGVTDGFDANGIPQWNVPTQSQNTSQVQNVTPVQRTTPPQRAVQPNTNPSQSFQRPVRQYN